jgi:protein-S-isoprenylcysteine O-methyltransferase Ste14
MDNFNKKAFGRVLSVLIVMGALLFFPAWTVHYWQAWVFLAVFGASGLAITGYLVKKDPKLLERRMRGGPTAEKETRQKIVMSMASIGFLAIPIVSAVDHRSHWSTVPLYAEIAGDILVALGMTIVFFVFKENTFASATIEVALDQKVISTGPYAVVRHPMYSGSYLYLIGTPVALGSRWGLFVIALMIPAFLWRLLDEEKFLKNNLSGYTEYCEKVRFRIVPLVW